MRVRYGPTVEQAWLREHLWASRGSWSVDCRFEPGRLRASEDRLARAGTPARRGFPRPRSATLQRSRKRNRSRHPLPEPARFEAAARAAGIGSGSCVVAYDEAGEGGARLWWLLRHFGHEAVAVLDGGLRAWREHGGPVEGGRFDPEPGDFTVRRATATRSWGRPPALRLPSHARRSRAGALPRRDGADRPGRRPHPRRRQRAVRRPGARRPLPGAGAAARAARQGPSWPTAGRASRPARWCSPPSWPAWRRGSTRARGASGRGAGSRSRPDRRPSPPPTDPLAGAPAGRALDPEAQQRTGRRLRDVLLVLSGQRLQRARCLPSTPSSATRPRSSTHASLDQSSS